MLEICSEVRPPAGQDPDVVGLGTLIAYAGSAVVAILGLIVQYILFHISPGEEQLLQQQQRQLRLPRANPFDALFLGTLRGVFRVFGIKFSWLNTPWQEGRFRAALDRCILSIGDIQLAMGFAALVYAYVTSLMEAMSVYLWWLTIGLVWFSVIANLATATSQRTYFAKNPGERGWRTLILVFLIIALGISMIPVIRVREILASNPDDVQRILSTNVLCYVPEPGEPIGPRSKSSGLLMIITVGVLVILYGLLKLYERPRSIVFKWRDNYRGEMQQSLFGNIITCIRCEQRYMLLVVRPVVALWLTLRVYADLLTSVLTGIFLVMAMFAWVVVRLIEIRTLGSDVWGRWTFGQIVPLVLFVAPLVPLATCICSGLFDALLACLRSIYRWLRRPRFTRRPAAELPELPVDQVGQPSQPTTMPTEANGHSVKGIRVAGENGVGMNDGVGSGRDGLMSAYKDAFIIFPSSWCITALPLAAFPSLLHLVLLMVLTNIPPYLTPSAILWKTIFWFIIYQPLALFVFILAGMIVEDRAKRRRRMRSAYAIIAIITFACTTASIFDTLYGLGGIPMSYIGMGVLGLSLLLYVLYGFVARPSPLAKGKGRRYLREGDLEEGRPLLGPRRTTSDIRIPVRKAKRWHGPSRRPSQFKRGSYGTIDELGSPAAQPE